MMILYKSIVIIKLFIRDFENTNDLFLSPTTIRYTLMLDLELPENQRSYFILEKIYKLTSCSNMPIFMDSKTFN